MPHLLLPRSHANSRAKLGAEAVRTDDETLAEVAGDKWFAARQPEIAAFPATTPR